MGPHIRGLKRDLFTLLQLENAIAVTICIHVCFRVPVYGVRISNEETCAVGSDSDGGEKATRYGYGRNSVWCRFVDFSKCILVRVCHIQKNAISCYAVWLVEACRSSVAISRGGVVTQWPGTAGYCGNQACQNIDLADGMVPEITQVEF